MPDRGGILMDACLVFDGERETVFHDSDGPNHRWKGKRRYSPYRTLYRDFWNNRATIRITRFGENGMAVRV